jgi:Nif-specific regulatory protein
VSEGEQVRPRLSVEERALLYDFGRTINAIVDLDRLLPEIVTRTRSLFGAESSTVMLRDAERDEFYVPSVADIVPAVERRLATVRVPADRGIAGAVLRSGEVEHVPDVSRDARWDGDVDGRTGMTTRSLLCAPLRGRAGMLGVLLLRNSLRGDFTAADLRLLPAVADHVGLAIDTARQLGEARGAADRLGDEIEALRRQLARGGATHDVIAHGPVMRHVMRLVESAAALAVPVLLQGENGTGKERLARAIHASGPRWARPFMAINCGAFGDTLLASELFGHRKGAFAGALADKRGLFEVADGGTVFLDEVSDMPLTVQPTLLRVLQQGEVVPLGDTVPRAVDVRLVSATHGDLAAAVRSGAFRADLFFRLSAFPIAVPSLRERRDDIPLLAARLLEQALRRFERPATHFTPAALTQLCAYGWPGNIRELQNEIERTVALAPPGTPIGVDNLSAHVQLAQPEPMPAPPPTASGITLRRARALFERDFIARVLTQNGGNASRAARALGISRVMLHKKLRAYGMRRMDLVRASA